MGAYWGELVKQLAVVVVLAATLPAAATSRNHEAAATAAAVITELTGCKLIVDRLARLCMLRRCDGEAGGGNRVGRRQDH